MRLSGLRTIGISLNAWKWTWPARGVPRKEALGNLREALELYFEDPRPEVFPEVVSLDAEVYAP